MNLIFQVYNTKPKVYFKMMLMIQLGFIIIALCKIHIGPNSYNTSKLISMELYDLGNEYTIPREAYRKLVRLMNTVIRDTEKLARGKKKKSSNPSATF
jgi:hypothetical protein